MQKAEAILFYRLKINSIMLNVPLLPIFTDMGMKRTSSKIFSARKPALNTSFPSYFVPLFQNESSCKTLRYENEFDLHENEPAGRTHFLYEWFRTKTCFDRGTRRLGNSLDILAKILDQESANQNT